MVITLAARVLPPVFAMADCADQDIVIGHIAKGVAAR